MRVKDEKQFNELAGRLAQYERAHPLLPGIRPSSARTTLLRRLIESSRRAAYLGHIASNPQRQESALPHQSAFNPLRAAVRHRDAGDVDEAGWLIFLATHFGRHRSSRWQYTSDVYGRLGRSPHWSWDELVDNPYSFDKWVRDHANEIRTRRAPSGFGNHRKYESLPLTGAVALSYLSWIQRHGSHRTLFDSSLRACNSNPTATFNLLYNEMSSVFRFGRTAKFDYLTTIGRLRIANVRPGKGYFVHSTGPLKGGKLLFGQRLRAHEIEAMAVDLEAYLGVGFDVLEDAICNWQKSPTNYSPFRG